VELDYLIDNAQKLPNIPRVVRELIESFGDEDINTDVIVKKISADQVLTAKLLRVANSAYYGGNRNIGSVNDAVFLLGFNAVRTLVLAAGITGAFKAPEGFDIKRFWHDSVAVAATSKWLARYSRDDAEMAFTCGMIHSIGQLLINILVPDDCKDIQKSVARGVSQHDAERTALGFDFAEAGAGLAQRWKFPEAIVHAVRYQLDPLGVPRFSRFACLIALATYTVNMNQAGDDRAMMAAFPNILADALDIDMLKMLESIAETKGLGADFERFL
jgi:HD-like signal output (HDOD) protein